MLFTDYDQINSALHFKHVDKFLICIFLCSFWCKKSWFWCCGVGIDGAFCVLLLAVCDHGSMASSALYCSEVEVLGLAGVKWWWADFICECRCDMIIDCCSRFIGYGFRFLILLLCFFVVGIVETMFCRWSCVMS